MMMTSRQWVKMEKYHFFDLMTIRYFSVFQSDMSTAPVPTLYLESICGIKIWEVPPPFRRLFTSFGGSLSLQFDKQVTILLSFQRHAHQWISFQWPFQHGLSPALETRPQRKKDPKVICSTGLIRLQGYSFQPALQASWYWWRSCQRTLLFSREILQVTLLHAHPMERQVCLRLLDIHVHWICMCILTVIHILPTPIVFP